MYMKIQGNVKHLSRKPRAKVRCLTKVLHFLRNVQIRKRLGQEPITNIIERKGLWQLGHVAKMSEDRKLNVGVEGNIVRSSRIKL